MDVHPETPPILSLRSFWQEYREHLPIWFVYIEALGLLHAALANFPEEGFAAAGLPRVHFAPPVAFALFWFAAYFVLRIRKSTRIRRRWKAYVWLGFMALALPLAVVLLYRPYPLTHDQLTVLFEVAQFLWVALFVVQILLTAGRWALLMFFGVTFVYGVLLENAGIIMRFFYEPRFFLYLRPLPAPLATMLGWCLVFYVTVALTRRFAHWLPAALHSAGRFAALATLIALCLDGQLDPLASMSGVFWRWNELLPPAFLGVPLINFAAWFGAFLPYTWFVFRTLQRRDWSPRRQNWELFLRVPLAAGLGGLLCFGLMAIFEGGFDGPTFQILQAFGNRLLPY